MSKIQPRENFPTLLVRLRTEAGESLRSLAAKADVPHSYISNIEKRRRPVGQEVAGRLAAALKLTGDDRTAFLLAATADSLRDKVVADVTKFPSEILNSLALVLAHNIKDQAVDACFLDVGVETLPIAVQEKMRQKDSPIPDRIDLAIRLKNGRWVICDFKIQIV